MKLESKNSKVENCKAKMNAVPLEAEDRLKKTAFTLSEVVITLIVIGVVAAITVPMMNNSVADKKWNVARQKARATIGEAFRLMTVNGEITTNKTTAQFVEDVIPKYLKLEKTCAPADYKDCGFPETVKTPKGVTVDVAPNNYKWSELSLAKVWNGTLVAYTNKYGTTYNTSYFFRTLDGFSVAFLYNPYCASDTKEYYDYYSTYSGNTYYSQYAMDVICLMGIYDMNGKQGPNKVGMDIGFVGSFYNGFETRSVAVLPHSEEKKYNQVQLLRQQEGKPDYWHALSNYCNNLGKNNDWIMPDIDEISLIRLNYKLIVNSNNAVSQWFLSRNPLGAPGKYYFRAINFRSDRDGQRGWDGGNGSSSNGPYVRCVRNTALK